MAQRKKTLKGERVPIGTLTADPANLRLHPDANLAAIRGSLARFGQQKPIVVDSGGVVVAGNGTLAAALELGWESLWVVRTELEGAEAIAFAIADNRTSELAEWDEEALPAVLGKLAEAGQLEGFDFLGIEREAEYAKIARERLGLKG